MFYKKQKIQNNEPKTSVKKNEKDKLTSLIKLIEKIGQKIAIRFLKIFNDENKLLLRILLFWSCH